VIASIEEPRLIERLLAHRRERGERRGGDALAWGAGAAAGVVVLRRPIVEGSRRYTLDPFTKMVDVYESRSTPSAKHRRM
jgi:hypothetical protein